VRASGVPVYNLAVVVDDHLMGITHVIRGEDHLTNTFKQVLIHRALGWELPVFAHLPLILGPSGEGKLSKRKHPEAALELYQEKGYPPEAIVNWLALIGWAFDDKTQLMTREELVGRFSFAAVHAGGARLPLDKLEWMGGEYIRAMEPGDVEAGIEPFLVAAGWIPVDCTGEDRRRLRLAAECGHERLHCFSEITDLVRFAFEPISDYEPKARKNLGKEGATALLESYLPVLAAGAFDDPAALEADARRFSEEHGIGFGKLVHPLRAALTGRTQGPGLFHCAALLGRDEALARVRAAIASFRAA